MKELSLSLLSRGCGRVLSSDAAEGCDGRLEVCFTPNDYYLWKSQESLLQLTSSGRLVADAQPGLPKTYSTRRGPLILYSQDLVTVKRRVKLEAGDKKKRVHSRNTQHVQKQLNNLKDLTTAILSYSNSQYTLSRRDPSLHSPLHFPAVHLPTPLPLNSPRARHDPAWFVPINLQWHPAWKHAELQENSAGEDTELEHKNIIRMDVFLQSASPSRRSSPQTEPKPWVHYVAMATEPEHTETYVDMFLQHPEGSGPPYTERRRRSTEEIQDPDFRCVQDMVCDEECPDWSNGGTDGEKVSPERTTSRNRHDSKGLFLPPLNDSISTRFEHNGERRRDKIKWKNSGDVAYYNAPHFPQIRKTDLVASAKKVQDHIYNDEQSQSENLGSHSQEILQKENEQPIVLPALFPEKEELKRMRGNKENTDKECVKNPRASREKGGGRRKLSSLNGPRIMLESNNDSGLVGLMDSGPGLKVPGKQSSMAYLQKGLLHPEDPRYAANRGVVKGLLPLELRDLQNSKPLGCLIMGPDGEILQLSLYTNNREPGQSDDDRPQQQALQVVSPEGETLPWVVMLQTQVTLDTDVEDNSGIMEEKGWHNQPMDTVPEHNMSPSVSATVVQSINERTFNGTPAFSPTAQTMTGIQERTDAGMQPKTVRKDVRNSIGMTEVRDNVGDKESRGGICETDKMKGDKAKKETGESGHLTGSHQTRKKDQLRDSGQTVTEPEELNRTDIKKKEYEETAVTPGKNDPGMPKSRELEEQRSSRGDGEGGRQQKKTESNSRRSKSRKSDDRTGKDSKVSQKGAAPPTAASGNNSDTMAVSVNSLENTARGRRGRMKEVKMNEEGDAGGEGEGAAAVLKEESAVRKKRRKGRLTQRDAVDENRELEMNLIPEEDSLRKTPKGFSQTHSDNCEIELKSEDDSEVDHVSNFDDRRSSIRSSQFNLKNVRRSATSSCEGTLVASVVDLASSRGRLSSCSAVMVMDEQLMLNTMKPEMSSPRMNQEEIAALRRANRAERRREEVERKRREQEEEERKQQERGQMEDRMKNELQEERRKRAEELRLKKLAEEEERKKREEEERARLKQEEAEREKERRRQEDRRRQMARLKKLREEEEQRRKADLERVRLEEQRRQEEENAMLQEMDENERKVYLFRKDQEDEERQKREDDEKRRKEEAALRAAEEARLEAGRLLREMALLQQHLSFKRTFDLEVGGLEKTQGISRPWVFSYFSLLQMMGLSPSEAEPTV